MATDITAMVPTVNGDDAVIALILEGVSDRPRIRLDLTSQSNPAFLASAQTIPETAAGSWSITFESHDDFFDGDISCDDILT